MPLFRGLIDGLKSSPLCSPAILSQHMAALGNQLPDIVNLWLSWMLEYRSLHWASELWFTLLCELLLILTWFL